MPLPHWMTREPTVPARHFDLMDRSHREHIGVLHAKIATLTDQANSARGLQTHIETLDRLFKEQQEHWEQRDAVSVQQVQEANEYIEGLRVKLQEVTAEAADEHIMAQLTQTQEALQEVSRRGSEWERKYRQLLEAVREAGVPIVGLQG